MCVPYTVHVVILVAAAMEKCETASCFQGFHIYQDISLDTHHWQVAFM